MDASKPTVSPLKLVSTGIYLLAFPALQLWLSGDWGWNPGLDLRPLAGDAVERYCFAWLYRRARLLAERYRRPGTGGQSRVDARIVYGLGDRVHPLDCRPAAGSRSAGHRCRPG